MTTDNIRITVLDDGTIKVDTDSISPSNHLNAENFLKEIFRMSGGKAEIEFKKPVSLREHGHSHDHGHGQHAH